MSGDDGGQAAALRQQPNPQIHDGGTMMIPTGRRAIGARAATIVTGVVPMMTNGGTENTRVIIARRVLATDITSTVPPKQDEAGADDRTLAGSRTDRSRAEAVAVAVRRTGTVVVEAEVGTEADSGDFRTILAAVGGT
jgi:hypothetical protein